MDKYTITGLVTITLGLGYLSQASAKSYDLEFLGEKIAANGSVYSDTTVGGLSGIDYHKTKNTYYAISDDRSS